MKLQDDVTRESLLDAMTLEIKNTRESLPWAWVPWERQLNYRTAAEAALRAMEVRDGDYN